MSRIDSQHTAHGRYENNYLTAQAKIEREEEHPKVVLIEFSTTGSAHEKFCTREGIDRCGEQKLLIAGKLLEDLDEGTEVVIDGVKYKVCGRGKQKRLEKQCEEQSAQQTQQEYYRQQQELSAERAEIQKQDNLQYARRTENTRRENRLEDLQTGELRREQLRSDNARVEAIKIDNMEIVKPTAKVIKIEANESTAAQFQINAPPVEHRTLTVNEILRTEDLSKTNG